MRLTYPTATVLQALAHGHRYGFDIIDVTGLHAGTVYPILRRLDEEGLLESTWESAATAQAEGRPPRRDYRMMPEGARAAERALERYPALARLFEGAAGGEPAPA